MQVGSGLFRNITFQPEYYPTRTEKSILTANCPKTDERKFADGNY